MFPGLSRSSSASRVFIYARARARLSALALLAGLLVSPGADAAPPSGTPIDNTATGTLTLAGGGSVTQPTNAVRAIVQTVESLSLTPDRGGIAPPGGSVTLAHRLVNTGNAPADIRLDAGNLAFDGFDAASFALTQDRDHDGLVGAGDTPVANGGVITLAAGDSADVLLTLGIPSTAPLGGLALVRLSATGLAQGATALVTDTLRTPQVGMQPVIVFYDAPDYLRSTHVAGLGAPIEVEALARGCDLDPTRIETVRLTLTSRATGDREVVDATETAPNSGLFRVLPGMPTVTGSLTSAAGDGVLATMRGDLVTAELAGCGATLTRASVWVEPGGFVYESRSDQGVAGVHVRLIDVSGAGNGGQPGGLARVFAGDGTSPSPADVVTDSRGAFSFPLVRRSTYRLEVVPPEAWSFPSHMGAAALPGSRLTDASGSYGGTFTTGDSLAPVAVDVPVDAVGAIALFAEQTASSPEVEWGDALEWTIRVANRSDSALATVRLTERLPLGFAYVHGSARALVTAGGAGAPRAVSDPPGAGPGLAFALGALGPRESVELRFNARVQAGAPTGDAQAVAQAFGTTTTCAGCPAPGPETPSNAAPASTRVRGDVFADEGGIVGTVSIRFSTPTRVTSTEPGTLGPPTGLAGVRLYLDDGTWAVTDAQGRFSFTAVTPRTHALKLDRTTLPPKAQPVSVDHRDAGTPGLRFVDLARGDLGRADFLIIADTTSLPEVKERMIAARWRDEGARVVAQSIQRPEQRALPGDARSLPSAAIVTGEHEIGAGTPRAAAASPPAAIAHAAAPDTATVAMASSEGEALEPDPYALPAAPTAAAALPPGAPPSLERVLPTLDHELGFVDLADMDTLTSRQVTVRVKGPAGSSLQLRLNGTRVPESRVGRRVTAAMLGLEAWEYVGVTLEPGVNVLELSTAHASSRVAVRVVTPGAPARLWLSGRSGVPADGHSESWLSLAVTDSAGVPVGARTLVTLEATRGHVPLEDLDPASPGLQIAVEGGRTRVPLLSPASPGRAEVVATSGGLRAVADVDFVPEMRPLLVVGSVEGAVGLDAVRSASGHAPRDGFEQPISEFFSESQDGSQSAGARAALYVKGRVRNDLELTLGYDSDRPDDMRQFRDLQIDHGYPVVGDASVRGYDAQSTGKLYGRLERRDASLLYGDLVTGGSDLSLANYARSLTGAAVTWGDDGSPGGVPKGTSGHAFTSRERSRQVIDELPGRGVSGPYRLTRTPVVENSERVEVLVRDRDQPAVVISTELRQRFTDYALDPLTGDLVFRSPVPSFDAALNPVTVRVTYEIEDATGAAWVSGMQVRQRLGSDLSVAGTYVDDHDPAARFELRGASALARLGARTTLEGEWAVTHTLAGTGAGPTGGGSSGIAGDAGRLELRHDDPVTQARVWAMAAASGFSNPGAGLAGGRTEAGGRWSTRLAERTRLTGEGLYSADAAGRTRRGGVLVSVDHALTDAWRGELGMRVAGESHFQAEPEASLSQDPLEATVRAKLLGQWPRHPEWSGYGEYEQDTQIASRRLAALGGEYHFSPRGRLYARHELASSLTGAWALSANQQRLATVAGVDADLARDAHVFSEYRLADAFAGREAQAAVGLRNAWRLANGIRVGGAFERVNTLAGAGAQEGPSTALSGSLDWVDDPRWKGSLRMEGRTSRESDQVLQSMAAAVKLDSSWTGLVRHQFTLGGSRGPAADDADERLQLAMAYRDPGGAPRRFGRWDVLGRWDLIYERPPVALAEGEAGSLQRHIANVIGLNGTGRLVRGFTTNVAWAGKLTSDRTAGLVARGLAQWLHGRLMRDFGRDWDASVSGSLRTGGSLAERQFGLGVEVGRQLPGGMWLSAGFNRFGYRDDELTGEEWTRTGGYVRIRARFDESLFRRAGGGP